MYVTKYLPQWCPFEDELLSHVVWVGFENRVNTTSSSVEYVVNGDLDATNEHLRSRINQLYDVVKHNNTAFDNERMRMNKRIMKLEEVIKQNRQVFVQLTPLKQ